MTNTISKKVAVIGLGKIGCRHLEALFKSIFPIELYGIDPQKSSVDIARKSIEDLPINKYVKSVSITKELKQLPKTLDLVVIATNSDIRLKILTELLDHVDVNFVILEKILFQRKKDLKQGKGILNKSGSEAWVNCPRRMWPLYRNIKRYFYGKNKVSYNLSGGNWGMGCNAIHFIDCFEYLTNSKLKEINTKLLDQVIHNSKRKGFIEFTGILEVSFDNQNSMILESVADNLSNLFSITISSEDTTISIDENLGNGEIILQDEPKKEFTFTVPFQSELTNLVAKEIMFDSKCFLTPYDESAMQHRVLLDAFNEHSGNILGKKIEYCRIT